MKKNLITATLSLICAAFIFASCGKVEDKVAEVKNDINVKGSWSLIRTEGVPVVGTIESPKDTDSLVFTFKDDKSVLVAASGSTVATKLSKDILVSSCGSAVRPYRTDKKTLVFEAVSGCQAQSVTVIALDGDSLKIPDADQPNLVRTFKKISDQRYNELVKPADRKI